MVIVGIMPVYEEADWIEWAIEGIIDFVDELIIAEGYQGPAWHFGTCRSQDGTIEIIERLARKYDKITLMQCQSRLHVLNGKAATHNHALEISRRIKEADWYMICDADEFYSDRQKEAIKKTLETAKQDAFRVNARFFLYNFDYFIYMHLGRFIRVTEGMYFMPGQFPFYTDGTPYYDDENPSGLLIEDDPMFHYSLVKRPVCEIKRRVMEYCAVQRYGWVFDWIDQVYLQWTQANAKEIYDLNRRRFNGQGGFLFDGAGQAQKLQVYEGQHPEVMDNHPYRHIEDIRKIHWPPMPAHKYITIRHRLSHYGLRAGRAVKSIIR
jgi:glycosyltransferase involved in cell wall biosynthesis